MNLSTVYHKRNFKVYDTGKGYIIHNTDLNFNKHHTHITNYDTCVYLVNICLHKSVPRRTVSEYLLNSLIRITDDQDYINKLEKKIQKQRRIKNRKRGDRIESGQRKNIS